MADMAIGTAGRRGVAALAVLTLALRLLIAPGYMPGFDLAHPIAICTGQAGAVEDGGHPAPPHRHHAVDCPFAAAAGTPLTPDGAATAIAPATIAAVSAIAPTLAAVSLPPAASPPPSRGPPVRR